MCWCKNDNFHLSGIIIVEGKISVYGYCFKCKKATYAYAIIKNGKFYNIELIKTGGKNGQKRI